jgi:hypothetical protein
MDFLIQLVFFAFGSQAPKPITECAYLMIGKIHSVSHDPYSFAPTVHNQRMVAELGCIPWQGMCGDEGCVKSWMMTAPSSR